jgi:type IV pilus assembly protein PilV
MIHPIRNDRVSMRLAQQRGVTLVEILVTVVIISVGLLGVAALHLTSLRAGQGSHTRSQATALANDIIDRIRANPRAAINGEYDLAFTDAAPITPTGLVAVDQQQWLDALARALPSGDGEIEFSESPLGQPTVRVGIQWAERKSAIEDETPGLEPPDRFETTVDLVRL